MTIGKRLDEAMKYAGLKSQGHLEQLSGIPQPTISRILKDSGKKGPESHTLKPLAESCGVNFAWLHEGIGPMERTDSRIVSASEMRPVTIADGDDPVFYRVPLVTSVRLQGGLPAFASHNEETEATELLVSRKWIEAKGYRPERLYALLVTGDSMYPTIKRGSTVIINTGDKRPTDGDYFAVMHDGSAVIKRLERDVGLWYLASDNAEPRYGRRAVTDPDTVILGRMVKLEQDF